MGAGVSKQQWELTAGVTKGLALRRPSRRTEKKEQGVQGGVHYWSEEDSGDPGAPQSQASSSCRCKVSSQHPLGSLVHSSGQIFSRI